MSYNYNKQYTTIYNETFYCIQYIYIYIYMKSVPAGRIRPAPRATSAAAAAALLQARLGSRDLKRAVDCSVRASRARLRQER